MENPAVIKADMIFAIGGGKSTDTGKCLGVKINKPVFSFPTIASNCSACTSVSIMYYPDGRFKEPFFYPAPPVHAFINTEITVNSPENIYGQAWEIPMPNILRQLCLQREKYFLIILPWG